MISAFFLVWIELLFVLLLSIITKNIRENKNIKLALDFIYVMLFFAVLKLAMFIYMTFNNISLCSLSRQLYCWVLERLVFHIYKGWTEIVYNDSIIFDSGLFLLYSIWYRIISIWCCSKETLIVLDSRVIYLN